MVTWRLAPPPASPLPASQGPGPAKQPFLPPSKPRGRCRSTGGRAPWEGLLRVLGQPLRPAPARPGPLATPTPAPPASRRPRGRDRAAPTSRTRLSRSAWVRLKATTCTPAACSALTVPRPMPAGSAAQCVRPPPRPPAAPGRPAGPPLPAPVTSARRPASPRFMAGVQCLSVAAVGGRGAGRRRGGARRGQSQAGVRVGGGDMEIAPPRRAPQARGSGGGGGAAGHLSGGGAAGHLSLKAV